jgi:hypothetical protein
MVEGSMFIQIHADERYGCPLMKDHIEGRNKKNFIQETKVGSFIVGVP